MKVYLIDTKEIDSLECSSINEEILKHINHHADEKVKKCSLFAYLLLFSLVGELNINFEKKPYIVNSNIKFNISHTGDYVCLVISNEEVGVDIEYKNRIISDTLKKKMMSTNELNEYLKVNEEESLISLWTKKEAYLKYLGNGINQRLNEIDTSKLKFISIDHQELVITIYGKGNIENINFINVNNYKNYIK